MEEKDKLLMKELNKYLQPTGYYMMDFASVKCLVEDVISCTASQILNICISCDNQCTSECETLQEFREKYCKRNS